MAFMSDTLGIPKSSFYPQDNISEIDFYTLDIEDEAQSCYESANEHYRKGQLNDALQWAQRAKRFVKYPGQNLNKYQLMKIEEIFAKYKLDFDKKLKNALITSVRLEQLKKEINANLKITEENSIDQLFYLFEENNDCRFSIDDINKFIENAKRIKSINIEQKIRILKEERKDLESLEKFKIRIYEDIRNLDKNSAEALIRFLTDRIDLRFSSNDLKGFIKSAERIRDNGLCVGYESIFDQKIAFLRRKKEEFEKETDRICEFYSYLLYSKI